MKQLQHVIIEYTHLLPTAATATAIPAATCENVSAVISDRTTTPGSIKSLKDKKISCGKCHRIKFYKFFSHVDLSSKAKKM